LEHRDLLRLLKTPPQGVPSDCQEQHKEPVSINRVQELRNQIANEAAQVGNQRYLKTKLSRKTSKLVINSQSAKT
jgi:hypothetical protein